jgi:hypothetical protein
VCCSRGLNILSSFKQVKDVKPPGQISEENIDNFDGVPQGHPPTGSAGGILYLKDSLSISFKQV